MHAIKNFNLLVLHQLMREQENISRVDQYVIDYVKALRTKNKLTQADLGNIIGVSRSFIRDIENPKSRAKYKISHLNALADYLAISPRLLLPEKPFPVDSIGEKSNKMNTSKKVKR